MTRFFPRTSGERRVFPHLGMGRGVVGGPHVELGEARREHFLGWDTRSTVLRKINNGKHCKNR
jgi:hypothetical protein